MEILLLSIITKIILGIKISVLYIHILGKNVYVKGIILRIFTIV